MDTPAEQVKPYLDELESRRDTEDGKFAYWKQAEGNRTAFYGSGKSGSVASTARSRPVFT